MEGHASVVSLANTGMPALYIGVAAAASIFRLTLTLLMFGRQQRVVKHLDPCH